MFKFENSKDMINQYRDCTFNYLVEETFRSKTINLIAGDGGCGKTTFCLQLVKAISEGGFFFGKKCTKSNVLWINNEMAKDFWTNRLQTTGEADFKVLSFEFTLGSEEYIENLAESAKTAGIEVIIIDSLVASLVNSDENDNVKMGLLFKKIRKIFCVDYGMTVFIIHHTGKGFGPQILDIYRVRGASAIKDGCDTVLMIAKYKDGDTIAKILKSRSGNDFNIWMKMTNGLFILDEKSNKSSKSLVDEICSILESEDNLKQFEICQKIKKVKSTILKCLAEYEDILWTKNKISKAYHYSLIKDGNDV